MCYFPNAVHIVQRDEIRYALWPDQWTRPVYCQNDYRDIRKLNILELESDFDLFNDGTLKLLKTPGHSPGHQVLIVDLPNRGRICLAADMRMKQLERTGIPLFFCHDASDFAKLPQNGQFWD
jgi:N-acyl homoserine lactone hydrolase